MSRLIRPPKIFWIKRNFYFIEKLNIIQKIIELVRQIIWIISGFISYYKKNKNLKKIPFKLYFKACILNCFKAEEVLFWRNYGINKWEEISKKIPNLQSTYFLNKGRSSWPNKSKKIIALLSDKSLYYESCTIDNILPKYHVIKNNEYSYPEWIKNYLCKEGIILKPSRGYRGKDIYHYVLENNILLCKNLNEGSVEKIHFNINKLYLLLRHWRKSTKSKDNILLMPYIKNSLDLPNANGSLVIRVITTKQKIHSIVNVKNIWFEIPLDKSFLFINLNGFVLNVFKTSQNSVLKELINKWTNAIKKNKGLINNINLCLKNSIKMHESLSDIDQIAWDWIPTKNYPKLLEGNANFSLLLPQVIDDINKTTYNKELINL